MKLNKALVSDLKGHFQKARKTGVDTLSKGQKLIKDKPVESALFTLLAANLIKRTKSRNGTSLEQPKKG